MEGLGAAKGEERMNQLVINDQWTRSQDGWIAGVCQGLGERFDINPGVLRFIWSISIFFFGVGVFAYFIFAFCLPVEGSEEKVNQPKILGVCYRLSRIMNVDVGLLRIISILIGLGSLGISALVYILLYFIIPKDES